MDHPYGRDARDLPPEVRGWLEDELERDERIVWLDQPQPLAYARKYRPLMVLGVIFLGVAVLLLAVFSWIIAKKGDDVPAFLPAFSLIPGALGFGFLSAPMWGRKKAKQICYAVTDRRAIIIAKTWGGLSIRSFRPAQIGAIERKQQPDGTGDLILARELTGVAEGSEANEIGFHGVAEVKKVESCLMAMIDHVTTTA